MVPHDRDKPSDCEKRPQVSINSTWVRAKWMGLNARRVVGLVTGNSVLCTIGWTGLEEVLKGWLWVGALRAGQFARYNSADDLFNTRWTANAPQMRLSTLLKTFLHFSVKIVGKVKGAIWRSVLDHNAFDVTVMHALLKWAKDWDPRCWISHQFLRWPVYLSSKLVDNYK